MYPGATDYALYNGLFEDNAAMFMSSMAGPAEDDLYGPPSSSLDVYGDGTPIGRYESMVAHAGTGTGMRHAHWYQRGDWHAIIITGIGFLMIKAHMKE
jgi:hypothetical protein